MPDASQPEIAQRARGWQFAPNADETEKTQTNEGKSVASQAAMQAAAAFIRDHQQAIYDRVVNEVQISLTALRCHPHFVGAATQASLTEADTAELIAEIRATLRP